MKATLLRHLPGKPRLARNNSTGSLPRGSFSRGSGPRIPSPPVPTSPPRRRRFSTTSPNVRESSNDCGISDETVVRSNEFASLDELVGAGDDYNSPGARSNAFDASPGTLGPFSSMWEGTQPGSRGPVGGLTGHYCRDERSSSVRSDEALSPLRIAAAGFKLVSRAVDARKWQAKGAAGSTFGSAPPRTGVGPIFEASQATSSSWDGTQELGSLGQPGSRRRRAARKSMAAFPEDMPTERRTWVLRHLEEREPEYMCRNDITVLCATWNVNAKKPNLEDPEWLSSWLGPGGRAAPGEAMADVYAVGIQEMVDLNAVNVTIDTKSQKCSLKWEQCVLSTLNSHAAKEMAGPQHGHWEGLEDGQDAFVQVGKQLLVGMWLAVFVRATMVSHVSDVRSGAWSMVWDYGKHHTSSWLPGPGTVTAGMLGVMGNKGAVGVRMRFQESSVCFVCTHLAAHRENVQARNDNYVKIMRSMEFSAAGPSSPSTSPQSPSLSPGDGRSTKRMSPFGTSWGRKGGTASTASTSTSTPPWEARRPGQHSPSDATAEAEARPDFGGTDTPDVSQHPPLPLGPSMEIQEHDVVFWFGDLNYRIDAGVPVGEVLDRARLRHLDFLREKDQLNMARANGEAFEGFHEGFIDFLPTYKYQPGKPFYDVRQDRKVRAPAWCDRVLHWCPEGGTVEQVSYRRSEKPFMSDHKPVCARFLVKCKQADPEAQERIFCDLLKEAELLEDEGQLKVEVSLLYGSVEFGEVRYLVEKQSSIWLHNTGRGVARYHICSSRSPDHPLGHRRRHEGGDGDFPGDTASLQVGHSGTSTPPRRRPEEAWYTVHPSHGTIIPGEKAEVKLFVHIGNTDARLLSAGQKTLEDIIILRVKAGKDRFIPITAVYAQSSYGCELGQLMRCTKPVRFESSPPGRRVRGQGEQDTLGGEEKEGTQAKRDAALVRYFEAPYEKGQGLAAGPRFNVTENEHSQLPQGLGVPKELWRMVDAANRGGVCAEEGVFCTEGIKSEVEQIREAVDKGLDFPPHSVHSMVEALVTFIASLANPLIPEEALPKGPIEHSDVSSASRALLERLPPLHYSNFAYLISFFRDVLKHTERTLLTSERLAVVCRMCMVADAYRTGAGRARQHDRPHASGQDTREGERAVDLILQNLLTTELI